MDKQPWIKSKYFDLSFIIGPSFVPVIIVIFLHSFSLLPDETNLIDWLLLVVFIDVAHVWSTLYKTYLNPGTLKRNQDLFFYVPLICWVLGAMVYSIKALFFWKLLAYLAVFHFIRQQYGFFMIYTKDTIYKEKWHQKIDKLIIYQTTIVPMIHWHVHYPKNFKWFISNDFFKLDFPIIENLSWIIYGITIILYLVKEKNNGQFNLPKNLFLLGTALSWFLGIVIFNGDWAFTMINIVSHGIPYIALIWSNSLDKQTIQTESMALKFIWNKNNIKRLAIFICLILTIAYIEEGLWDSLVWKDHSVLFPFLTDIPKMESKNVFAWLIPLLSVPQAAHYVLDGFIWKSKFH